MKGRTKKYQTDLLLSLRNPQEAVAYLNAALEEGEPELFLVALRNVVEAYGGLLRLSNKTRLNRENLYRMLSKKGNPGIYSLNTILNELGVKLVVQVEGDERLNYSEIIPGH